MSVATRTTHIIKCDALACPKRVQSWTGFAAAQAYAAHAGWVLAEGIDQEDYCPMHRHLGERNGNDSADHLRASM
jgi:hypothetical protein